MTGYPFELGGDESDSDYRCVVPLLELFLCSLCRELCSNWSVWGAYLCVLTGVCGEATSVF